MGLFDKKYCDICGEKIGLLGNKKLEDGNMCKDCAEKLSPFFSDRKNSTIEEIKQQLKYREENAIRLNELNPDKIFGKGLKIYVDTAAKKFFATRSTNWKDANPDIIAFTQVSGVDIDVIEDKEEIFDEDKEGNKKSYFPQRFEYSYKFEATIRVNSPWFDEITVDLSNGDYPDTRLCEQYHELEKELYELKSVLTGVVVEAPQQQILDGIQQVVSTFINAAGGTITVTDTTASGSWKCSCGAVNSGNFCPNCGTKRPVVASVIRCDKCGWMTEDVNNPPRFCPNCGDPINIADVK